MGQIIIKDLEVFGNHGVFQEETVLGQKFLICAQLSVDMSRVSKKDEITEAVNYAAVCEYIKSFMKHNTFNLIETVADRLAQKILIEFELVNEITIEVKKPWAPIRLTLQTVSAKTNRAWHKVYIALGSNMGDTNKYLNDAIALIEANSKCRVGKVSDFIETKPVSHVEQDDFLNGCMEVDTMYTPHELLEFVHKIEDGAKRERKIFWGPRTLDLDIILYDDLVMSDNKLIIPHLRMHERQFVLEPLKQIAPYVVHPLKNKRVFELFEDLDKKESN